MNYFVESKRILFEYKLISIYFFTHQIKVEKFFSKRHIETKRGKVKYIEMHMKFENDSV